ncbi:MAG: HAD family phosphatase [Oscillospiraceae bacterium]
MKIKGAIFDLDGTILDSMFIWDTIAQKYLQSKGIVFPSGLNKQFLKMSILQAAQYFKDNYGLLESTDEIVDEINGMIEYFYKGVVKIKPGMLELLQAFKKDDVKMCIATATDRYMVEEALEFTKISEYFSGIITCTELECDKNTPTIFKKALSTIGTNKENTIVFEDALHAIESAKSDGFCVAGVYDKSADSVQEKIKEISDYYITSYHDFLSIIAKEQ